MSKNTKVCILSTVHPAFDDRIFHKEAKTLAQAGYDVTLIAQHDGDTEVEGVRIIGLSKPKNRFTRILILTWRAFWLALRQRADIYHFHDPELLPWGALLRLTTRARCIYDVHENVKKQILNKVWLSPWTRKLLSWAYMLVERTCLPLINEIVIAEDSYSANYRGQRDVIALRNYPILTYMEAYTDDIKSDKWADDTFKVVYVGGITKLRGALELVEALKGIVTDGHREAVLNLIGPVIPIGLKNELKSSIQKYNLERNVRIPGAVPHEKVFGILTQSHIGIAVLHPDPNYLESLPVKLFEYMAAGLPVIASNFPLWKEIVEGNECGLTVDPLDPKEIAQAIEYLITHPEEARVMGESGRRAVIEKYNWETEGRKLLELYEKILGERVAG